MDVEVDEEAYIEPQMFKAAAAEGSADFLSGGQQCAMEYLQHLLGKIEECEKKRNVPAKERVSSLFAAELEERVQCVEDKKKADEDKEKTKAKTKTKAKAKKKKKKKGKKKK